MTKKDYILKLLDMLHDIWPIAGGIKILVEGNILDEQSIDGIIKIIETSIDHITDTLVKEKLEKSKNFLENLKHAELESKQKDAQDVEELDQLLQNI